MGLLYISLTQQFGEGVIKLNRHHARGPLDQPVREDTSSRTDLDDRVLRRNIQRIRDPIDDVPVGPESADRAA